MTYTIVRTVLYKDQAFYYQTFGKHMDARKAKTQWEKVKNFKNPACKYYLIPDDKIEGFLALCEKKYQEQAEIVQRNAEIKAKRWEVMERNYFKHGCRVSDAMAYVNR